MSNRDKDGMFLTNEQLHFLLCLMDHSVVNRDDITEKQRSNLIDIAHDLSWDIAERFEYDLNKGTIDPSDYKFKIFTKLK